MDARTTHTDQSNGKGNVECKVSTINYGYSDNSTLLLASLTNKLCKKAQIVYGQDGEINLLSSNDRIMFACCIYRNKNGYYGFVNVYNKQ